MTRPLEGIRVVEWAGFHNGPAAGYMLADLGADVIKVEQPGVGDPLRGMSQMWGETLSLAGGRIILFELADRGKRSIAVDLKSSKGREVFYRLIEKADVFLTNYYRDGVLERLGIDYDSLSRLNPRLVYAVNSGYGQEGPLADERGFDTVAQARSGMMWSLGDRSSHEPQLSVAGPCDQVGATVFAFSIVTALLARERLGVGQRVDVSLYGAGVHMQAIQLNVHMLRGRSWARHSRTRIKNPLTNHYRCADGKWILLAEAQSDRFWSQFCRVLGAEELETDPRFAAVVPRRENARELIRILDDVFATRARDEWLARFQEMGAEFAYAPVFDDADVVRDPQALANGYVTDFNHPTLGPVKAVGLPMRFSKTPWGISREAPELGQHTEEVLLEMGYSWEDIAQMREQGVL